MFTKKEVSLQQFLDKLPEEQDSKIEGSNFENEKASANKNQFYQVQIVWRNVFAMVILHALGFYGLAQLGRCGLATFLFAMLFGILTSLGVQAGAHRLWSHRAYKANFGVRLFLSLCFVAAAQNDIYEWVRDHRAHHKFSETDADPHNSSRGFFFSHVGWLLVKKHPDVICRGKTIDLSDLMADPIVRFQRRFYIPLVLLIWGLLPTFVPVYFWGESVWLSFLVCVMLRYTYSLNGTWMTNSWAHLYGSRPYDKQIAPVESTTRHVLMGEGFHNYHHSFPWDYSASELGAFEVFNPATALIDFFAFMGWAWDLKKVNPKLVEKKMVSRGDQQVKEMFQSKKPNALMEWLGGALTIFGPLTFIRCFSLYWN